MKMTYISGLKNLIKSFQKKGIMKHAWVIQLKRMARDLKIIEHTIHDTKKENVLNCNMAWLSYLYLGKFMKVKKKNFDIKYTN